MKKNISINISGIIFNIEEDGYDRLRIYLDEIKRYFATYDDTGEIAADIENRVAEIFLTRLNPQKQVITSADVDSLIAQMGNVKDFEAIEEPEEPAEKPGPDPRRYFEETDPLPGKEEDDGSKEPNDPATPGQKLFRDGKRKVIAGVASGIAHYFRIDAFWVRLLFLVILLDLFISVSFSSVLLVGYIVMWLIVPERFDLSEDRKIRKMFRNPADKVVGGVASGLAAYFGVDPTLIRIVFIITIFLGGSGIIAYLIMWVITPKAVTLTDRMQMQGEPVTLSNIEQNIKKNLNVKEGDEKILLKILLFPFRFISAVFSGAGQVLSPLFKFLGDAIRVIAGMALILIGFSFLLGLFTAASFALGIIPDVYIELFHIQMPEAFTQESLPGSLIASGFISMFIPGLMVILLGIAIIAKKWLLNRAVSWVMFALWIVSLLVFVVSLPAFIVDFKTRGYYETENTFPVDTTRTVVLDLRKEKIINLKDTEISVKGSEEPEMRLEKRFMARGRNETAAKEIAERTIYTVSRKGDTLLFSPNFRLPEDTPFRGQKVEATLYIPAGQKFTIDYSMKNFLTYTLNRYGYSTSDIREKNVFVFKNADQLVCLSCPEQPEETTDSNSTPASVSGAHKRVIEAKDFKNVSAGSNYEVFFTQSPDYSVKLEGEEDAVKSLEFEQDGNTVHFRSSFSFFDEKNTKVKIFISLPELEDLELNGAAKATLTNWKADRLRVDLSGASEALIEGEILEPEAGLSGNSKVKLRGNGNQLQADLSGSSELNALDFKAKEAELDMSGASFAGVHATDQLSVDASGVSHLKYKGNPSVSLEKSNSSRIEKLD